MKRLGFVDGSFGGRRKFGFDGYSNVIPPPTSNLIGDLVIPTDFYNSGNWTTIGSPGVSFGANYIDFSAGGSLTNFSNGIIFNPFISDRNLLTWQLDLTLNAASTAFSIGMSPYNNTSQYAFAGLFGFSSPFAGGQMRVYPNNGANTILGNYGGAINIGNTFRLTFQFLESFVRLSVKNLSVGFSTTSFDYNFVYSPPTPLARMCNTYKLTLWTHGGNFRVSNLSCNAGTAEKNGILLLGNSKTVNEFPGSFAGSFLGLLRASNPGVNIYYDASVNEGSVEQLARINDLLKYQPSKLFIVDATNDRRNGYGGATSIANHTSIKNQFNAIGTQVYFVNAMPENVLDARLTNNDLTPVFTPNIADTYTALVDPSNIPKPFTANIDSDGKHPNNSAQPIIANVIDLLIP